MTGRITVTGTINGSAWDTGVSTTRFLNNHDTSSPNFGRLATGLKSSLWLAFSTPDIPPKVKVESAKITLRLAATNALETFSATAGALIKDGKWDAEGFDGWTAWTSSSIKLQAVESGTGTTKIETYTAADNETIPLRNDELEAAYHQKVGQKISNTGANFVLRTVNVKLARVGSPVGNVGLELYNADPSGNELPVAGSAPIAVSTERDASGLSTSATLYGFDFVSGPTLVAGSGYVVAITGSWTNDNTKYVNVTSRSLNTPTQVYAGGHTVTSGTGEKFSRQIYPTGYAMPRSVFPGTTAWEMHTGLAGAPVTISGLAYTVQEAINDWQYDQHRVIAFYLDHLDAAVGEDPTIALSENGTYPAPILEVTYKPRRILID